MKNNMNSTTLTPSLRFRAQIIEFTIQVFFTTSFFIITAFVFIPVGRVLKLDQLETGTNNPFTNPVFAIWVYTMIAFYILSFFVPAILVTHSKTMFGYKKSNLKIINEDGSDLSRLKWFIRSIVKLITSIFIVFGLLGVAIIIIPSFITNGEKDIVDIICKTKAKLGVNH